MAGSKGFEVGSSPSGPTHTSRSRSASAHENAYDVNRARPWAARRATGAGKGMRGEVHGVIMPQGDGRCQLRPFPTPA
jgi:hypothetical protein